MSNTDPTIAFGLNGVNDYTPELPFLDWMKNSSRMWGFISGWSDLDYAGVVASGVLDADGWPTAIPDGMNGLRFVFARPVGEKSRAMVLTYEGTGTITGGGSVSAGTGRRTFTMSGTNVWFDITATDPGETGDYIRNIRIFEARFEELLDAGEIFNPDWLEVIQDARQVRFMDWMGTNGSTQSEWANRPQVDDVTYSSSLGGPPVEIMVALANKIGADPWFNIPHMATDEWISEFASYVRDNLDPGLVAHVEYSNETWNFGFGQYVWLAYTAAYDWGKWQGVTTDDAGYSQGATEITLASGGSGGALTTNSSIRFAPGGTRYRVTSGLADIATGGAITIQQWDNAAAGLSAAIPAVETPMVEGYNGDEWIQYSAKRATEAAIIWDDVFGEDADARLYHVIGVQMGNPGLANAQINGTLWQTNEPDDYVDPATVFDALGITTYFGGTHTSSSGRNSTISIASPGVITTTGNHGKSVNDPIVLYTTGALPTPFEPWATYYVASVPSGTTLTLSATPGGPAINTSGSQSGAHKINYLRAELINYINTHAYEEAFDWLTDRLLNRDDIDWTIPYIEEQLISWRAFADTNGLDMAAYEGGSHEGHSFGISFETGQLAILTPFYAEYSYSPQIATVYAAMYDLWSQYGDGPFMQFVDVATPSQYGAWGMMRDLYDGDNPRAALLFELNATTPSWFGDGGGEQYLNEVAALIEDDDRTVPVNKRGGTIYRDGTGLLTAPCSSPLSEFTRAKTEGGDITYTHEAGVLTLKAGHKGVASFPAAA